MVGQTVALGKRNLRLEPELGFPVRALDVNMHPGFLQGEEEGPEGTLSKDRWRHETRLTAFDGTPYYA